MIRLPDTYYTKQMLDGNPEQTGLYMPPPQFYQGEDIVFKILLNVDGQPLTTDHWIVEVFVKKNTYADNTLWLSQMGTGLIDRFEDIDGQFQIWIPSSATATFLPGLYTMAVQIIERTGTGEGQKDRKLMIYQTVFNIGLAASSPNPKLRPSTVVETSTDIETGITTITRTGVEPTLPNPVDTSHNV